MREREKERVAHIRFWRGEWWVGRGWTLLLILSAVVMGFPT